MNLTTQTTGDGLRGCPVVLLLVLLLVAVMGCATTSPISVGHQYEPDADYSGFRTYDWLPIPPHVKVSDLVIQRTKESVAAILAKKGIVETARNPDFRIALHAEKKERYDMSFWGYEIRKRQIRRGVEGVDEFIYEEGTLVLDVIDPRLNELAWRGWARGVIDPTATPDQRRQRLNEAVEKILERFPPGPGTN